MGQFLVSNTYRIFIDIFVINLVSFGGESTKIRCRINHNINTPAIESNEFHQNFRFF